MLGRSKTQVLEEQFLVGAVLTNGLAHVALCKMHANEDALCAFSKWLDGHGRQRGTGRLTMTPRLQTPHRESLERVQPQLTKSFALDQYPVVVPIGKQVTAQLVLVEIQETSAGALTQKIVRHVDHLPDVDSDMRRETKVGAPRFDEIEPGAAQTPETGSEARARFLVGGLVPKDAGDVRSEERSIAQCKEGKQTLCAGWKIDRSIVANQLKSAQKIEAYIPMFRYLVHVVGLSQRAPSLHGAWGAFSD